jgi:shikimate dehydrogenase
LNGRTYRFGLIGYPLEHSASARYFTSKFERERLNNYSYSLFPLMHLDEIKALTASIPGLQGLNVTIPYKQSIIPLLDQLDPVAAEIGAVNTVVVKRNNKGFLLSGYNTDAKGFRLSLPQDFNHTHALVLGTGGASAAVTYVLKTMGIEVLKVSRDKRSEGIIGYEEINKDVLERFTFIINSTPSGMFPQTNAAPALPFHLLGPRHFVYDLIYNPAETLLLKQAREAGASTQNGMEMLKLQAELAFKIWMGEKW